MRHPLMALLLPLLFVSPCCATRAGQGESAVRTMILAPVEFDEEGRAIGPFLLRKGMIPPKQLEGKCPPPDYPLEIRRARITGRVVLLIGVQEDGTVSRVRVHSGPDELIALATEAAKRCRYAPATDDGKPVHVWLPMPYVFRLEP